MIFNVWTFLFEVINFVVLVYVLRWLLYRPLHEAIDRRREANAKAQADAEKARQEAAALQQQLNEKIAVFEKEREGLIRTARSQAEAERKTTIAEAERIARLRHEDLELQLQRERTDALQALHDELVQSAVSLAARFLHEASSATLEQQLTGRLIEELEHLPDDERQRFRGELGAGDAAIVESAADLNGAVVQGLEAAIESLAGRKVSLSVQIRPELIGGLRLRLGGHVWDASLASGLVEVAPAARESVSR